MKKVVTKPPTDTIKADDLNPNIPVFAKKQGKLKGMIVKETRGWVLKLGGELGGYGYWTTLAQCIREGETYGYEFFVED